MTDNPSLIEKSRERFKKEIEKLIKKEKEQLEEEYNIDTENIDVDELVDYLIQSGQIIDGKEKVKINQDLKYIDYIDDEDGEVSRERPIIKVTIQLDENLRLEAQLNPEELEGSFIGKSYLVYKKNKKRNDIYIDLKSVFPIYQLQKFEGDLDKLEEFINNSPDGDKYLEHFLEKEDSKTVHSIDNHKLGEYAKILAVIIKNKNEGKTSQEIIKKDIHRNFQVFNQDYKDYKNIILIMTNKEIYVAGINRHGMTSVIRTISLKKEFKERIRFSKSLVDALNIILNYADLNEVNKKLGKDFLVFKFLDCKE